MRFSFYLLDEPYPTRLLANGKARRGHESHPPDSARSRRRGVGSSEGAGRCTSAKPQRHWGSLRRTASEPSRTTQRLTRSEAPIRLVWLAGMETNETASVMGEAAFREPFARAGPRRFGHSRPRGDPCRAGGLATIAVGETRSPGGQDFDGFAVKGGRSADCVEVASVAVGDAVASVGRLAVDEVLKEQACARGVTKGV